MGTSSTLKTLALELPRESLPIFYPLLQRGVRIPVELGRPLKELLCGQLGIEESYITGRITTIFLDNRPVDDLDRTLIHEGARLTLSAAMPGLVGATMRRGGFYAPFRRGISHTGLETELDQGKGFITLKLFNLLLSELGPAVLHHGIVLDTAGWQALRGELVVAEGSCGKQGGDEAILLRIRFGD